MRTRARWEAVAGLQLKVERDGRSLAVSVAYAAGRWVVLALATGTAHELGEVLTDHGHKHVGTFRSLPRALRRGERYAERWRVGDVDACGCAELGS